MNIRQYDLIHRLLTSEERYLLVNDLAKELNCSEKTVRNDLKYVSELFEKYSTIKLNRKPGYGIFLLGSEEDRQRLLKMFQNNWEKSNNERIFDITYELLTANRPLTLQHFSDLHFTNRTDINKDLEQIAEWLKPFKIELHTRQKVGVYLEADEAKRRSAIAYLIATYKAQEEMITRLFPEHEVTFVKSVLTKHDFSFADETFNRLVIHILIMIKRIKQKSPIQFPAKGTNLLEQPEYELAKQLLKEIEPFFTIRIPESEISYLALHLIGGKKLRAGKHDNPYIEKLVTELITEMTRLTNVDFNQDKTLFQGLSIHLQPVLNRLSYQLPIKNPLLDEIKNKYPYMFSMVILALKKSEDLFSMLLLEDEVAYIALHFQASVERQKQMPRQKKKAIIVCHLGIGMAHLVRSRIERQFPDLQIEHSISKADLPKYMGDDIDLIISTVDLPNIPMKHIVISPLFDLTDQERLHNLIKIGDSSGKNQNDYSTLLHFIDEDSIFLQVDLEHRYEVVEMLATSLYHNGFVKESYIRDVVIRERTSATSIGSSIAIPHGNPSGILRSSIAVASLKKPLEWGSEQVSLIFLLAVVDEGKETTKNLFNQLSGLSDQGNLVKELVKQTDKQAFIECLVQ